MSEKTQADRSQPRGIPPLERQLQLLVDLLVLSGAFVAAYLLRFEFAIPASEQHDMLWQLPFVVLLQLTITSLLGIRDGIERFDPVPDRHIRCAREVQLTTDIGGQNFLRILTGQRRPKRE